ncbi:MAG: DUF5916 domain-containing protein [Agriterribacter sp.]
MRFLVIICTLIFSVRANGQDSLNFAPPPVSPVIYASEANENMSIDGRLNEAVWQTAPMHNQFFRMEPRQGGAYLYATYVRAAYDKKNIYFGVFCKDSTGKRGIRVQDYKRDFFFSVNDDFFISLDPQNLKRYCVSFHATPLGTQRDAQVFDDTYTDNDWDAIWKVRSNITDSGYYLEYAIPFTSLRYNKVKPGDSASWGITYSRLVVRDYEQIVFPAVPQSFSPYRMSYAAQLKGLQLPPPSLNLRINPYGLYQYSKTKTNTLVTKNTDIKFGGDVKWAVNPHAVIDATFNTDFAQADVDVAVNNLTRFNVFFPEKRQFFLENNGVFAGADISNIKPYFSRTIGLANTQYNATPVPIDGGVRYTDRTQQRTLAAMYVHQKGTEEQSAAHFGILRYLKNYGKQDNIGIMLTHRLDEADAGKGVIQRNNSTLSIDGLIRPRDAITIQYLATASRNNSNDSIGTAGSVYVGWNPNQAYLYYWVDLVSEKYVPGMGYVFASNTVRNSAGGYFIWRPGKKAGNQIRRWDPGVFVTTYHNVSDGRFQSAEIDAFPVWIFFRNNNTFFVDIYMNWEQFFFSPLGINVKPGNYFYTQFNPRFTTDASKKLSGGIGVSAGNYYDGRKYQLDCNLRIAPNPHIAFTATYQNIGIRNLGIDKTDANYTITTAGARLAVNPRIQASVFYQYNSYTKQARWNARGSWEFAPLSFVYLVFNDNSLSGSGDYSRSFINKITYIKQF